MNKWTLPWAKVNRDSLEYWSLDCVRSSQRPRNNEFSFVVCFSNCNVQTVSGNFITGDEKKSHNPDEVPREKGAKLFLSVKNKAQKMTTRSGGHLHSWELLRAALDRIGWSANSSAWGQGFIVYGGRGAGGCLQEWPWPSGWGTGWCVRGKKTPQIR